VKFFGAPLITTGGFTFDFTEKKVECKDEYFMTTRIGNLAFRDIANFFVTVMDRYAYFAHSFTREMPSIISLALPVLHLFLSKFLLFFLKETRLTINLTLYMRITSKDDTTNNDISSSFFSLFLH